MRSSAARSSMPARAAVVAAAVVALLATWLPATASPAHSANPPVEPVTPVFTGVVDVKPEYQGQVLCDLAPKPGTVRLATSSRRRTRPIRRRYERDCAAGGQSEHKDGRALDWMVSVRDAGQKAAAEAFLAWLLEPDADGVPAAMARRLGVMYIGWDDRIWRGYGTTGWDELFDCQTNAAKAAPAYDTTCHRNHIHISLTWDGAAAITSFYDGTSVTAGACPAPTTTPTAPAAMAYQLVPVPAVRVLDTAARIGVAAPCRAYGPGWSGQRRAVSVKVTGQGGVPATGVGAVLLRVYPVGTNTTTSLQVWTTGASSPTGNPAASGYRGKGVTSTYVVPVASDGTVRFATTYGATDLAADVLAWAPTANQVGIASTTRGNVHIQAPSTAATLTVAAGETAVVPLGGTAGVPASGLTGVQLRVSAAAASGISGSVRVGSVTADGPQLPARFTVPVAGTSVRSASATVATDDGRIAIRNYSAAPVTITLDVLGWYGTVKDTQGLRFVPRAPVGSSTPARCSASPGPLVAGTPAAVAVPVTAVPTTARRSWCSPCRPAAGRPPALVLERPGAASTGRSADVVSGTWTTDLVLVPLGADRSLVLRSTAAADVRMHIVGYLR
ncbi:MAG: hypothetical protein U0S36_12245 [Candidatus Nanopelagicales bacterium]